MISLISTNHTNRTDYADYGTSIRGYIEMVSSYSSLGFYSQPKLYSTATFDPTPAILPHLSGLYVELRGYSTLSQRSCNIPVISLCGSLAKMTKLGNTDHNGLCQETLLVMSLLVIVCSSESFFTQQL